MQTIGQNLKKLRRINNITQEKLAEAVDVHISTVRMWETKNLEKLSYPDAFQIIVICDELNTTPNKLLGYEPIEVDNG